MKVYMFDIATMNKSTMERCESKDSFTRLLLSVIEVPATPG
jgi:hypothetical protein